MRKTLLILICALSAICTAQSTRQTVKSNHGFATAISINDPGTVTPRPPTKKLDDYYPAPSQTIAYREPGGGAPSMPRKVD